MDPFDVAQEVFDGVVLSDGSLVRRPGRPRSPILWVGQAGEEHVDWLCNVRDVLVDLGLTFGSIIIANRNDGPRKFCALRSRVSPYLDLQRQRWYPNGKKVVPEDFRFTPMSLAHEFMGDGSSSYMTHRRSWTVSLQLAVCCFSVEEVDGLVASLREDIGLAHVGSYLNRRSGPYITIGVNSVDQFMDIVEPYIVPSYQYKVKRNIRRPRRAPIL